jgi:hypothetical protein
VVLGMEHRDLHMPGKQCPQPPVASFLEANLEAVLRTPGRWDRHSPSPSQATGDLGSTLILERPLCSFTLFKYFSAKTYKVEFN